MNVSKRCCQGVGRVLRVIFHISFTPRHLYSNQKCQRRWNSELTTSTWVKGLSSPIQKAAAAASDAPKEALEGLHGHIQAPQLLNSATQRRTGGFSRLPVVPSAEEHLTSAVKRANRVTGNKALKNKAQHARNLSARKLDALTKEIATPLGNILRGFPNPKQLHPFEAALLDLTLGISSYERRLSKLDALRKACLEVGKSFAGRAAKAAKGKDAFAVLEEGFSSVEAIYRKNAASLDAVKDIAKILRKLPVVDPSIPTVALVGAPNVGKSSLVQVLSSGLPEVCNYPFTTRTVKIGHFFVDGKRHQVTDTPGLLDREEENRNAMERLTVACLQHLPTAVVFVIDLTGECGTSLRSQWKIRNALRARFPTKPWLDAFSKGDLLEGVSRQGTRDADSATCAEFGSSWFGGHNGESENVLADMSAQQFLQSLPDAIIYSSVDNSGIADLKAAVLTILQTNRSHKVSTEQLVY